LYFSLPLSLHDVFLLAESQHEYPQIYVTPGPSPVKILFSMCYQKMELCITTARLRSVYCCLSFFSVTYAEK
jgi:hypothetical protein